jgi:hypothetical protein
MVRAVKLQISGSGRYFNPSQGVFNKLTLAGAANRPPVLADQAVPAARNQVNTLPLDIRDPDGDPLTCNTVLAPSHGAIVWDGANLVYTPKAGFSGTDTFTCVAWDGLADSRVAAVTVNVATQATPTYERQIISINCAASLTNAMYALATADLAGAVPVGYWNNLAATPQPSTNYDLKTSNGKATAAYRAYAACTIVEGSNLLTSAYGDTLPTSSNTPHHRLLNSAIQTAHDKPERFITVTLRNLPVDFTDYGYDVYVYAFTDGYYGSYRGAQRVDVDVGNDGSAEATDSMTYHYNNSITNFDGVLSRARNGSVGEYVKLSLLSQQKDTVRIKVTCTVGSTRAFLSGIQIVSVPKPFRGFLWQIR